MVLNMNNIIFVLLDLLVATVKCDYTKQQNEVKTHSRTNVGITICFNPDNPDLKYYLNNHPPSDIPPFEDRIYSISAEMFMPRMIVAFLCEEGTNLLIKKDHPMSSNRIPRYFRVKSVSENPLNDDYDGKLCQLALNNFSFFFPGRLDPEWQTFECGSDEDSFVGLKSPIRIVDNMLIAQGLMHTKPSSKKRKIMFELLDTYPFENEVISVVYTNPFFIDPPVRGIRWAKFDIENIYTNQPFNVTLEIFGDDGEIVTSGYASTLMVELTISYHYKSFHKTGLKSGLLQETLVELAGKDVITSERTNDKVVQKRAKNGIATFDDVRIQNYKCKHVVLNATLVIPRGLWHRVPRNYSDLKCADNVQLFNDKLNLMSNRSGCIFNYELCKNSSNAVALSPLIILKYQTAKSFKVNFDFGSLRSLEFTANFEIGGISYELLDETENRVFSGPDSDLDIKVTTIPDGIHVHYDSDSNMQCGFGTFHGSVTQVVSNVKLCFSVTTDKGISFKQQCSQSLNIKGDIHLAVFGHFKHSGNVYKTDPLIETFARFAVEDINDGLGANMLMDYLPKFSNRKFVIEGYETKLDLYTTLLKYKQLSRTGKMIPSKKVRCVIGFMSDVITRDVLPLTKRDKVLTIGVREQSSEIKSDGLVKFSTSDRLFFELLARLFLKRNWKLINVLRSEMSDLTDAFYEVMRMNRIDIFLDIFFPDVPESDWTSDIFVPRLQQLKNSKSKIIFNFLRAPLQYAVIRHAIKLEIAAINGYQWISLGIPAMEFPTSDNHPLCSNEKPTCAEAMSGTLLIHEFHFLDYSSDLWLHVHQKFFEMDRALYKGTPRVYPYYIVSSFARGYDAVLLYAKILSNSLKSKKTVNEKEIKEIIYQNSFKGLTGTIYLKNYIRRDEFWTLVSIRRKPNTSSTALITAQMCRHLSFTMYEEKWILVEVLQQSEYEMKNYELGIMTLPKTNFVQKRLFYSRVGILARNTHKIILPTTEEADKLFPIVRVLGSTSRKKRETLLKDPMTLVLRVEYVVMDYYCQNGCGGVVIEEFNMNNYTNGVCVGLNVCRCKTVREIMSNAPEKYWHNKAFTGPNCKDAVCEKCEHGNCVDPETCMCYEGYEGLDCDSAICDGGCGVGECILPNVCKCPSGLVGPHCTIILIVLMGPFMTIVIMTTCCCLNCYLHWRRRTEMHKLMYSTDWLVLWKDVTPLWRERRKFGSKLFQSSEDSTVSSPLALVAGSFSDKQLHHLIIWRNKRCYYQKVICEVSFLNIGHIRGETITAVRLNHPNIVELLGVCLDEPHVGFVTEFYPKGSLEDILMDKKFQMDWNMKFSVLKDIARGMEYIHFYIGHHGSLRSSNCIMDNQLTVRITSFGLPTMRTTLKPKGGVVKSIHLLWIAPELLRMTDTFTYIPGSKPGDVYSFGIIMSELCHENLPYATERNVLSAQEIVLLLKNYNDESNLGLKWTYVRFGGNEFEPIRPQIDYSRLPEPEEESKSYVELMTKCWHESPLFRPNFTQVLSQLNVIKPPKEHLIDQTIGRLEEYSNKLEEGFVYTSKVLELQKFRLEQLLTQMLPKKIVQDLMNGNNFRTEYFDMVTICFVDIADFTLIVKDKDPFDVVKLLNQLYIQFDAVLEKFDVYKVSSVRDEFMIVSGLPVRNGYLHAAEIVLMALQMLKSIIDIQTKTFVGVPMLRFGIHSGPCIGGVVGLQIPQYCLFGDAINVALKMKNTSGALRIQVSECTANILTRIGGFTLEYHEKIEIEGREKMDTYWLIGAVNVTQSKSNPRSRGTMRVSTT